MRKASKIVAVMFSVVLCMSMVPSVSYAAAKEPAVTEVASEGVDADEVLHTESIAYDCTAGSVSRIGEVHCRHTNPARDNLTTMRQYLYTIPGYNGFGEACLYDWYRCIICRYEEKYERIM